MVIRDREKKSSPVAELAPEKVEESESVVVPQQKKHDSGVAVIRKQIKETKHSAEEEPKQSLGEAFEEAAPVKVKGGVSPPETMNEEPKEDKTSTMRNIEQEHTNIVHKY